MSALRSDGYHGFPGHAIAISGAVRQAAYLSGSGSATLVFEYIVGAGDIDGIAVGALSLPDGAAIFDGVRNPVDLAALPRGESAVTVDTLAPAAPTGGLDAGSDSGASSGDGISNVATPVMSGMAKAGAAVAVTLNGKTYTMTADAAGQYSVTVLAGDALADGSYTPSVTVTDMAGNSTTAAGTAFIVDNIPPPAPTLSLLADNGALAVSGLEAGTTWEFSLDGGDTWTAVRTWAGVASHDGHAYKVYESASSLAQVVIEQSIRLAANGAVL